MRSSITNARSFPSADVGSDHQLVLANIKLKLKAKKRPTQQMKKYNVSKLRSSETKLKFQTTIGGKFEALLHDPETYLDVKDTWTKIKEAFHTTSEEVLGSQRSQPQALWMTQDIIELTDQISKLRLETISNPARKPEYSYLTREINRRCKKRKEEWIKDVCKDIEILTDHTSLKSPGRRTRPSKNSQGNQVQESSQLKARMETSWLKKKR